MTNITGCTFLSTDGKTQLHGMRWEPEGRSVRAVLQICHGVAEHIARYDAWGLRRGRGYSWPAGCCFEGSLPASSSWRSRTRASRS